MDVSLSITGIAALLAAGVIGGFINTLAGGGSMLTLPALMLIGMPADIANATNRVGVLFQSLAGVKGFKDQDKLDSSAVGPVLIPTLLGALVGSLFAAFLPVVVLKPILLGTMVTLALVMLIKPGAVIPEPGTEPYKVFERPIAAVMLFGAGVYGGFVQAGVGFILIAALAGGLRYDLVRTNALKMVCTAAFSIVALIVFISRDQVLWVPGLLLAAGMVAGATLSVRVAINVPQNALKWLLFVMVTLTCVGALLFD
ncbi:sulfite exporter TauE/SafE family protein [Pseudomonadales bacterium]|nr:sulfite exporter TauE/SafE family protein [Pseudomonadales bacterium]